VVHQRFGQRLRNRRPALAAGGTREQYGV
jgi:hypothetical protein